MALQLAIMPRTPGEESDIDHASEIDDEEEMDADDEGDDSSEPSHDHSAASGNDDSSLASDGASFADRCVDTSQDCAGLDKAVVPVLRYVNWLPPFDPAKRIYFPTQKHIEDLSLLSAMIYGAKFNRGPKYRRDAKLALQALFPFLSIGSVKLVFETYRQFAAAFYCLDVGLRCVFERFGVDSHKQLRALASHNHRAPLFKFESSLQVFEKANPLRLVPKIHELRLIERIGEWKRSVNRTTGLGMLYEVRNSSDFDDNLRLEAEWLVFHLTCPQLRPHMQHDPRGNIPLHMRAAYPINHRPNSGWLFAFCLARFRGEDDGVYANDERVQCLECMHHGEYKTYVRKRSQLDKIMIHLEQKHNDAHNMVKALSQLEYLAHVNDMFPE